MSDQPPAVPEEFQSPTLFQQPVTVGRPPSSTSTSAPLPSSTQSPDPSSPAESSTSQAPSSSTGPLDGASVAGPAAPPSGSSPSDPSGRSLRERIEDGLRSVTSTAHHTLTDDVGRAHDLFLATEPEISATADGAASIITRRLGPVVGSSELGDLIQIGMAVTSYAARTFTRWRQAKAQRVQLAKATVQQPAPGV